ncbi:hypothetical protein SALBM311S_12290 [Streptomyces alboniger]
MLSELSRLVLAAGVATAAGALAASGPTSQVVGLAAGCVTVAAVFLVLGRALDTQGCTFALHSVRTVTRRLRHGRSR